MATYKKGETVRVDMKMALSGTPDPDKAIEAKILEVFDNGQLNVRHEKGDTVISVRRVVTLL